MTAIPLLVPGDPEQYTGGYVYDAQIARALTRAGHPVTPHGLRGRFPTPDAAAAQALEMALAACVDGSVAIIDGLALGGLPDIAERHATRLRLVALVHHPLADEFGIEPAVAQRLYASERRALRFVTRIVVTSRFTERRLVQAFGVDATRLAVVEPGVDPPQGLAHNTPVRPPLLLCVAALVPRKGHTVLIEALRRIIDLAWHCELIGDAGRDPACTRAVRRAIQRCHLETRVRVTGLCDPGALAAAYRGAYLLVLPSWYEGYGMVIAEAVARGVPVATTTGGALAETLPPHAGIAVPPGDVTALAAALRQVLADPQRRAALAAGARQASAALPTWGESAARFATVLERAAGRHVA